MTADPIVWDLALYLDEEPGSPVTSSWAEVLLALDAGQDADPLAVVSGLDGEVFLRLRPLRVRLDVDVLTVVGVLLAADGEAGEAVVTICARPAAVRTSTPASWPPVQGLPPEVADQLDWALLPGLLTEALRAQSPEVQERLRADGRGIVALPFDEEGCATFLAADVALLRLHWHALLPQPPRTG